MHVFVAGQVILNRYTMNIQWIGLGSHRNDIKIKKWGTNMVSNCQILEKKLYSKSMTAFAIGSFQKIDLNSLRKKCVKSDFLNTYGVAKRWFGACGTDWNRKISTNRLCLEGKFQVLWKNEMNEMDEMKWKMVFIYNTFQ